MTGCEHPIDIAAVSYIRFARSITYDGSNGSSGVPTRRMRWRSK